MGHGDVSPDSPSHTNNQLSPPKEGHGKEEDTVKDVRRKKNDSIHETLHQEEPETSNPVCHKRHGTVLEVRSEVIGEPSEITKQIEPSSPGHEPFSPRQTLQVHQYALDKAPPPIRTRREKDPHAASPPDLSPPPSPKRMRELVRKDDIHTLAFSSPVPSNFNELHQDCRVDT